MRSKWKTIPLLFIVILLLCTSGCSNKSIADTSNQSAQQEQTQNDATSSNNESTQNVSIPPFRGTVTVGKLPLIDIPNSEWEQAKQDFNVEYPSLKGTMKSIKSSDFALTDNWQGILDNEQFILNVYSFQAQYLLAVSEYGNQPEKIKIIISGPKCVFAFYGESVWLMQEVKGVGTSLNIVTDEFEEFPYSINNLNLEFSGIFTKFSALESEKRLAGTRLQIDGYNLLVVHDMVIAVTDK